MKKILSSLFISVILVLIIGYYKYNKAMSECGGCGVTPDGVISSGPYLSDFLISSSYLVIPIFIVVYIIFFILNKIKKQ